MDRFMSEMESILNSIIESPQEQAVSRVESIGWTKEFETGVDILDAQHRRYVELLNDYLVKASDSTMAPDDKVIQLVEALNVLRQSSEKHFSIEESIMNNAEFPDIEPHQEEHAYFIRHLQELSDNLETNGFSPELSQQVNYYIVEWFIQHILLLDMQLIDFLKIRV